MRRFSIAETDAPPRQIFNRRAMLQHMHATPKLQHSSYIAGMRLALKANRYGHITLSHPEIAALGHFSPRTSIRALKIMVGMGLVHKQIRLIPGTKRRGKNSYTFLNQATGTAHPFTDDTVPTPASSAAKMAADSLLLKQEKDLKDLKEMKMSEEDRSANLAAVRALIGALSGQMALGGA